MGVQGLTPFLQRHCPQVVKELPERLRDFGGKTIVFDGTLITHRFHFAPHPHQYRHVLGWYRLINELKNNDVNAICVFDGASRSAAKVLEGERRQSARQLTLARWTMEVKRQQRLQSLSKILKKYRSLSLQERRAASAGLISSISEASRKSRRTLPSVPDDSIIEQADDIAGQPVGPWPAADVYEEEERIHTRNEDHLLPQLSMHEGDPVLWTDEPVILDQDFTDLEHRAPPSLKYDLSEQLSALYASHETSSKTIQAISEPTPAEPDEASESKNQLVLTRDEGLLWSDIQSVVTNPRDLTTHVLLGDLLTRSKILSENYERRCKPPTQETYEESKMMLEALGVPTIECNGPYEAEGLASSLVRHGLAHFVASEDTDVLVYGATLLRNMTSRHGAIVAISSEEVRRALRLSRAAFMDFALLIGTDFSSRLRNVGPVRALNFISTHARIEQIIKKETRYTPPDIKTYLAQIRRARQIFTTLPPVPRKELLEPAEVDKERVTELLHRFGLSRAATDADWDPQASLAGNYFSDSPVGEGTVVGVSEMHFY
ncbi:PIN domain-like protein [Fomitiporia mediterranea MF3/22]|uniref:PIN domain-like protein n=1 Tax=Fomitiporia mediterranea (strain MF3/22) TaxID=694068 RepID=UPI0004408A54|nr:PIN domain-like protein [Fomitiporia mediterranea MF3/22]EJD03088.1 PIN domain-like protein [Fomitiporia mediterranea MF3/22]